MTRAYDRELVRRRCESLAAAAKALSARADTPDWLRYRAGRIASEASALAADMDKAAELEASNTTA